MNARCDCPVCLADRLFAVAFRVVIWFGSAYLMAHILVAAGVGR